MCRAGCNILRHAYGVLKDSGWFDGEEGNWIVVLEKASGLDATGFFFWSPTFDSPTTEARFKKFKLS